MPCVRVWHDQVAPCAVAGWVDVFRKVKAEHAAAVAFNERETVVVALDIKSGDSVIFIKRIQSFDGAATIIDELWLPGLLFKGLTAERLIEYKGPMYGLFETEFGTRMIRASERVRAVGADADAAALLAVACDTPLLSVERISYSYGDRPVEVRRSLYLTSRHHYQNELG